MVVTGILILFYATIGVYIFGGYGFYYIPGWDNLPSLISTCTLCFTGNGWFTAYKDMVRTLKTISDPAPLLPACMFLGVAVVVFHFSIFNVYVGMYISGINEANVMFKDCKVKDREQSKANLEKYAIEHRKQQLADLNEHDRIIAMTAEEKKKEKKRKKRITTLRKLRDMKLKGDFYGQHAEFRKKLSNEYSGYEVSTSLMTDLAWIQTEYDSLDNLDDQTYKLQQLFFEMGDVLKKKVDFEAVKVPR